MCAGGIHHWHCEHGVLQSDIPYLRAQMLPIGKTSLHLCSDALDHVLDVRQRCVPPNDYILLEEHERTHEPRPATEAALPVATDVAVATPQLDARESRLHVVLRGRGRVAGDLSQSEVQSVLGVVDRDGVDERYLVRLDGLCEVAAAPDFSPLVACGDTTAIGEVEAPVEAGNEKLREADVERVRLELEGHRHVCG